MTYRYYTVMRPPMIGAIPKENIFMIEAYDELRFIKCIGREAWGCVEYSVKLTEDEIDQYELVPERDYDEDDRRLVIYKYPLNFMVDVNAIIAPIVKPLHVAFQDGRPFMWALVDKAAPEKQFEVICIGTGQDIYDNMKPFEYLGTTISRDDKFVLHWFINEIK